MHMLHRLYGVGAIIHFIVKSSEYSLMQWEIVILMYLPGTPKLM